MQLRKNIHNIRGGGGGNLIFIIKPSHKAVLECFNYDKYIILEDMDVAKIMQSSKVCLTPTKGHIFPAHFHPLNKHNLLQNNIKQSYINLLEIDSIMQKPSNMPLLSDELKLKLSKIAPLEKIILYLPEANSIDSLSQIIFENECKVLHNLGYKILLNSTKKEFDSKYAINLNLSLKDAIALSLICRFVISMRSGFCDVISTHCKNLRIYYPSKEMIDFWSLKILHLNDNAIEVSQSDYVKTPPKEINNFLAYRFYNRIHKKGFFNKLKLPFTLFKIYNENKRLLALELDFSDIDSKNIESNLSYFLRSYDLVLSQEILNLYKNPLNIFTFPFKLKKINKLYHANNNKLLQDKLKKEWVKILESSNI
ncbi:hypothetical protein DCO58_05750 [Helicobacter saguini]|uniref:Uncharacterized protein n=1 Tax=Helicobacter saguini TaxID=1548018 RepID=A0A4U8SZR6_9HELI|nr:hypothetical protein [Helicobacter saguini]MWV67179.1 hypothetical protein [Helicobacter saguini]TLD92541.1 hypothetical protein LS64_010150 [Helicobacter saguini]